MVELVVAVTFLAVGTWWFLTREEKVLPKSDAVVDAPKAGDTVDTPFGPVTLPTDKDLNKLTKVNLEKLGREHGVELDRRKTKANMIADLKEAVK